MDDDTAADARQATRTRLDRAAVQLQARRNIASGLLTEDLNLAQRVQALGFDETTARVFDLLPVIHVAWADGEVQAPEREAIMRVLEAREIEPGTPAYEMVTALIEVHPGQAYLDETLAVLRELVADNNRRAEALIDLCYVIAEAHGGGLFGWRDPIDPREKNALFTVAEALGERAHAWVKAKFGEP